MRISAVPLVALLLAGCVSSRPAPIVPQPGVGTAAPAAAPDLYAVLWQQTAAEYEASSLQAYALAGQRLAAALADPSWTALAEQQGQDLAGLPPAVILDVDETVLDNGPSAARQILTGRPFNETDWGAWVDESAAEALPGAVEFLAEARRRGVAAFYLTNRTAAQAPATAENLRRVGIAATADEVLGKDPERGWPSDKTSRRAEVAKTHRVLLLVGDDLNDFLAARGKSVAERAALVRQAASRWGQQWIILPNPVYGSWERALLEAGGEGEAREQVLRRALDPQPAP